MEEYQVRITDEALKDMENIYNYIAYTILVPDSAKTQYNRIAESILSLSFLPERYQLFEEEPKHSLGIRRLVVDNYLICYVVDPGVVTVTDVLYGASNVHQRLKVRHN